MDKKKIIIAAFGGIAVTIALFFVYTFINREPSPSHIEEQIIIRANLEPTETNIKIFADSLIEELNLQFSLYQTELYTLYDKSEVSLASVGILSNRFNVVTGRIFEEFKEFILSVAKDNIERANTLNLRYNNDLIVSIHKVNITWDEISTALPPGYQWVP